jgi:protein TonB
VNEGYPQRAIRREIQGSVGVSVVIGTNGRVSSCSVTASSGESVLDDGACSAMERYARYDTALDDAGNPTTGRDSLTIVYRLN